MKKPVWMAVFVTVLLLTLPGLIRAGVELSGETTVSLGGLAAGLGRQAEGLRDTLTGLDETLIVGMLSVVAGLVLAWGFRGVGRQAPRRVRRMANTGCPVSEIALATGLPRDVVRALLDSGNAFRNPGRFGRRSATWPRRRSEVVDAA